jgi:hypothetical protein
MLHIRTRGQSYQSNGTLESFQQELANSKQQFIKINGELVKKSEVLGVKEISETTTLSGKPDFVQTEKQKENLYVYEYLKAHIPKYTRNKGSRLDIDEIRAVIAEARYNYNDN